MLREARLCLNLKWFPSTPPAAFPHKSGAFVGAPGFNSNGQAEPAHFKVLACAKTLVRRICGGGPQARWLKRSCTPLPLR